MPPAWAWRSLLAEPRGFCAGVDRAIEIVRACAAQVRGPIYVRHEIVHNTFVVNDLKAKGAIFIETWRRCLPAPRWCSRRTGSAALSRPEAQARGSRSSTPPARWWTKVHVEVAKLARKAMNSFMIGHKGHPEVEGTMGQLDHGIHLVEEVDDVARVQPSQTDKLAVVTQTTLSVDDAAGDHGGACCAASPRSASPSSRTSAMPPRTARTP